MPLWAQPKHGILERKIYYMLANMPHGIWGLLYFNHHLESKVVTPYFLTKKKANNILLYSLPRVYNYILKLKLFVLEAGATSQRCIRSCKLITKTNFWMEISKWSAIWKVETFLDVNIQENTTWEDDSMLCSTML